MGWGKDDTDVGLKKFLPDLIVLKTKRNLQSNRVQKVKFELIWDFLLATLYG